jgi:DNA-binding NtrC family response regulator/tRNA A-37 threonylcarbamoyl transferase component Bud32
LQSLLPPQLQRRYRFIEVLGTGGMGRVVAAWDCLGRDAVAIKSTDWAVPELDRRLAAEFALLRSVEHPGVVRVRDLHRVSGKTFVVSDRLVGDRLDVWLAQNPPERAVQAVFRHLLSTLGWLHARGVVHGDIKPANAIVLGPASDPWPVLFDFGLSLSLGAEGDALGHTEAFAAPELLRTRRASPASDLYALAKTLETWPPAGQIEWAQEAVSALGKPRPEERSSAAAHLALGGAPLERLGAMLSQGAEPWQAEAAWLSHAVLERGAGGPGVLEVSVASPADAERFAHLAAAELSVAGVEVWRLPLGPQRPPGLEPWLRVLEALEPDAGRRVRGRAEGAWRSVQALRDARRAVADDLALSVASAVAGAAPPVVLLVTLPERVNDLDAAVLDVLRQRGATAVVVGPGLPNAHLSLPPPDSAQVSRVLSAHGVELPASPAVLRAIELVARAGWAALTRALHRWADQGCLLAESPGTWKWRAGAAVELIAGALDTGAARALYDALEPAAQAALRELWLLGGAAPMSGLRAALPWPSWVMLVEALWVRLDSGPSVGLTPQVTEWFDSGVIDVPPPTPVERQRAVDWLLAAEPSVPRALQLSAHLRALGRAHESLGPLAALRQSLERLLDLSGAAVVSLERGRAASEWAQRYGWSPDAAREALRDCEQAARYAEVTGPGHLLDAVLLLVQAPARALGAPEGGARRALLEARLAVHRGELERALGLAAEIDEIGGSAALTEPLRLELALLRGVALAQRPDRAVAREALAVAAALAREQGDIHALGRAANGLATVAYMAGDWPSAAVHFREAAQAKRQTEDVRGERVATTNLAMALRSSEQLASAAIACLDASLAAAQLGDRRGVATSSLLAALLLVDLGVAKSAGALVRRAGEPEWPSEVTRLDACVVEARIALHALELERACALAQSTAQEALQRKHWNIAADACALEVASRAAGQATGLAFAARGLDGLEAALDAVLKGDPGGGSAPVLRASAAWIAGQLGDWAAARSAVNAAMSLPRRAWLGAEGVLGALVATAELVGVDPSPLLERAREVVEHRLAEAQVLAAELRRRSAPARSCLPELEDAPPDLDLSPSSRAGFASALGLTAAVPHHAARLAPVAAPAPARAPAPEPSLAAPDDAQDPAAWAVVAKAALGASQCVVVELDAQGQPVVVHGGSEPALRYSPAWNRIAVGDAEFFAVADGRVELCALALTVRGQPVLGALCARFEPGRGPTRSEVSARAALSRCGAGLALALRQITEQAQALARAASAERAERTAQAARFESELSALHSKLHRSQSLSDLNFEHGELVVRSEPMRQVLRTLEKVSHTDLPVLLLGESGVGKELLARAVHNNSHRKAGPWVAENCGAIPAELFESTFFGHVKGAFTGAVGRREGLFAQASGGTLFLDEVGELSAEHQVKLLRVLQEGRMRPVGAEREVEVDVRVVAATNLDLEQALRDGTLREDLYYRIAVVTVEVPALRARRADILPIAQRFLEAVALQRGQELRLTSEAAEAMVEYDWPGNVRELQNAVWRAAALADGPGVRLEHLPRELRKRPRATLPVEASALEWDGRTPLSEMVDALERKVITLALERARGRKSAAARMLGLSRPGLDSKLQRLGIELPVIVK